ncbi:PKD domain-containing protein [Candidatus Gracilibacteria bacterium]|nr:PKD domain-containing protein [Candidatus Gracilibacteria bacterium]
MSDAFGANSSDSVTITVEEVAINDLVASSSSPTVLGQSTSFSASASGSNLSYSWSFGDGATANGANVSHSYAAAGVYTATVTVRNSQGSRSVDVVVMVTNDAPTVNAGADQLVSVADTVVLNGTASDADGHMPLSYSWQQAGGPIITLVGADTAAPTFVAPATATVLTFTLTVTDAFGALGSDTVVVTVREIGSGDLIASSNSPTVLGQATSFSAITNGSNVSYSWSFGDGATGEGANVSHTYAAEGTYTATVTVRNSEGTHSAALTVLVTNRAPLADAGVDRNVQAGTEVLLTGLGSDPDGHMPLNYRWRQTSGTNIELSNIGGPALRFIAPSVAGVLSFELTVSDAYEKSTTDTVRVIVEQATPAGSTKIYLPIVGNRAGKPTEQKAADLVVTRFTVNPAQPQAGKPAEVIVEITNQGETAAAPFWVDFYINPSAPPTQAGQIWNERCTLSPCYGIAWAVSQGLQPGEKIVLRSTPDSYDAGSTNWPGYFASGTRSLYVYVDSWNGSDPAGNVEESDETNNRAEILDPCRTGALPAAQSNHDAVLELAPRRSLGR